jgi:hypothetical protein
MAGRVNEVVCGMAASLTKHKILPAFAVLVRRGAPRGRAR